MLDIDDIALLEAPGDEDQAGGNVDLAANNTDGADQNQDQENADQNTDDNQNDDQNANQDNQNDQNNDENQDNDTQNKADQSNDDNFDIDTDEGDVPDDDNNNDNAGNNNQNNEEPKETEQEKEDNSLLDKVYDKLTPAEKQRRDTMLREQYKDLYSAIELLISNTEKFPNTTDTKNIVSRLIRNLRDFMQYISYYFTEIYSTKSHLENLFKYRQFIQIYSGIESIYNDLSEALSHSTDSYGRSIEELNKQQLKLD